MITVLVSKGAEVDGLKLDDEIEAKLMGGITDDERVSYSIQLLRLRLAASVQASDFSTMEDAVQYVKDHTTIQT